MSDNENRQLEQLFGGNKRIKAMLEQACGFSNKTSATDDAQPVFRDKQSLLRHVVQRAKSLGTWIEIEPLIGSMIGNGQYEISDVKCSNVLVDLDGNLHFIDAVVNDISVRIDKINKISTQLSHVF